MTDYRGVVLGLSPSLYWRLGESSGTTAQDETANDRDGTYTGGFTLGQTGALPDSSDKAVLLNGTTGRIPSSYLAFEAGHAFTVAIWAKSIDTRNDAACALFGGVEASPHVYCRINPSNGSVVFTPNRSTANPAATWTAAVSTVNAFHFYVLTFSDAGDVAEFYVDGVSKGSRAVTAVSGSRNFQAGYDAVGSTWPGTIDEVAVWKDTILSASNIARLYSIGRSKLGAAPLSASATLTAAGIRHSNHAALSATAAMSAIPSWTLAPEQNWGVTSEQSWTSVSEGNWPADSDGDWTSADEDRWATSTDPRW